MEYKLDVIDRDSLDAEHQGLHPKQWLVVAPDASIQYFDTEEEACSAQAQGGFVSE